MPEIGSDRDGSSSVVKVVAGDSVEKKDKRRSRSVGSGHCEELLIHGMLDWYK